MTGPAEPCALTGTQGTPPAVYWWQCDLSGNVAALCAECCAYWRASGAADPDIAPRRVWLVTDPSGGLAGSQA